MNLSSTPEMNPNELSETRGIVIFQGFCVSERLQDGIAADQTLVQAHLGLHLARDRLHAAHGREILNHCGRGG